MSSSVRLACAAAALCACTGTISGPESSVAPGASEPSRASSGPGALAPAQIDGLCTTDAPHPRNLLRLSAGEILTSLRAVAPIDTATVPGGFVVSALGSKPDQTLAVSRDFHETLNTIVLDVARKVSASPGANLACAVTDFGGNDACTRDFVTRMAGQLYRGTATADDVTALAALAKDVAQRSGGKTALEYTVRAMALSPRSLYLSEGLDLPTGADPRRPTPLSAAEVASFLSYRIAGRPPGDKLIQALRAAGALNAQKLQGVLADNFTLEDLQRGAADFFAAFLNVGDITRVVKDTKKHPEATPAYLQSLQTETYASITALMKADKVDLRQALTTDQRSTLLGDAKSAAVARSGRPGLITLPGVLATVSSSDHTDIPRRGRFVLKALLCEPVPSPPADLVQMLPPPPPGASERQRFEKVEMEPTCAPCHVRVNRLGFALETYDELGAARLQDEHGNAIRTDSVHTLSSGGELRFADARDLMTQAAQHPTVQGCLALQSFRYFARRDERGAEDACLVRDVASSGRASGFRLLDLFRETLVRIALAPRAN